MAHAAGSVTRHRWRLRARLVVKRAVYSTLALVAHLRRRPRVVPDLAQMKEVLVVQLGLLGDVLLITPLLQLLRESLPADARITLVVPPVSLVVAQGNPHVDVVKEYDAFWADPSQNHRHAFRPRHLLASWHFIRAGRQVEYDLVINCWMMDQPLTPFLLSFLRSKTILGFDFPYSRSFCDVTAPFDPDRHISDNALGLFQSVSSPVGSATAKKLHYVIPPGIRTPAFDEYVREIGEPYLIISPFSSERAKEWDLENWATVLNAVGHAYPQATMVVTGLAEARARSEALTSAVDVRVRNAVGQLTFAQFALLMKRAAGVVTTDSGAMHLASALDVPVFVLFSQIYDYRQYVPYRVLNDYSVVPVTCARCIFGCAEVLCMKHDASQVLERLLQLCRQLPPLGEPASTRN